MPRFHWTQHIGPSHYPLLLNHHRAGRSNRSGGSKKTPTAKALLGEPGFEPFERDDGLHSDKMVQAMYKLSDNAWPQENGYRGGNPWHEYANSGERQSGDIMSGWSLRNSNLPARVLEQHSETAYMTDRALDCIDGTGDQLGRIFKVLEDRSMMDKTMIVFTSDHSDYLGDHWLGEKQLFYDCSMRVPLIIYDPHDEADDTRGQVSRKFVEAINLLPSFLDVPDHEVPCHRLGGCSLKPLLEGDQPENWRDPAFSEIDYGFYQACETLGVPLEQARGYALRTQGWKFVYFKGLRPQLFDLKADPDELCDLGDDPNLAPVCQQLQPRLLERLTNRRNRVTLGDKSVAPMRPNNSKSGVVTGQW